MRYFAILSFWLLAVQAVLGATGKDCILDSYGVETCNDASVSLPSIVRQSAPCAKNDMKCWCIKAKDYTNDVRRRRGMTKMLKVGTESMLNNAVRYAGVLGDKGFLEHQTLSEATKEVGCGRWIGGENIAYNYESGDVAKACVNQWESSQGHLENILRDWFEEVVIGFHFEPDGRVYCVQTFAQKSSSGTTGSPNGPGCKAVTRGSGGPKPTRPAPTRPAPTRPAPTRSPRPTRKPTMNQRSKDQGNRSCRCIELGNRCWVSLRMLSGNRCVPLTASRKQPMRCKRKCCIYCRSYPNAPPCRSRRVKSICRNM